MSASRALVVHPEKQSLEYELPSGKVETYYLTERPEVSAALVQDAIADIKENLPMSALVDELNRAARLMFVAYTGVTGVPGIYDRVGQRHYDLLILTTECNEVMKDFRDRTEMIIGKVIQAFKFLLNAKDDRAVKRIEQCAEHAQYMADVSGDLAGKFKGLMNDTQVDSNKVREKYSEQLVLVAELEEQQDKLKANLAAKQTNHDELVKAIAQLNEDIAWAKAEVQSQEERAFIEGIVAAVMGGLGTAVGAGAQMYMTATNPVAAAVPALNAVTSKVATTKEDGTGDAEGEGSGKGDSGSTDEVSAELAEAEETAKQAQSKVDEASEEVADAQTKVEETTATMDDAVQKQDEAKAKGDTSAEVAIQGDVDAASEANEEALDLRTKASEKLKDAKKDLTDAQKAAKIVAEGLQQGAARFDKMADRAAAAEDQVRGALMTMITAKREQERLDREALSSIARLTVQLESSKHREDIAESSAASLQMAVWAFSNIGNALLNAQRFWNNMARFCSKLANDPVIGELTEEVHSGDSAAERIEYYTSDMFMPIGVYYLSKWVGLHAVCDEYVQASADSILTIEENRSVERNQERAREALPGLIAELQEEIAQAQTASRARSEAMKSNVIPPTVTFAEEPKEIAEV